MSLQHVPFTTYKKELKRATVLNLLSQGYSTRQISRRLNCGISGCKKLVSRMKRDSLLTPQNRPTLKGIDLIERYLMGCQNVPPLHVPSDTIRLHDLVIKCKVEDSEWESKRERLTHLKIKGLKSWKTVGGKTTWFPYDLETSVRLTSKSVLIKLPDVYGSTPLMVKEEALKIFYLIRERLEQMLKVKLKQRAQFNFSIISNQHIALVHDEIAKFFLKENITLRIYDQRRDLLWVVDDSLGLSELEAVHKAKAEECGESMKGLIYDVSTKPHKLPSELTLELDKVKADLCGLRKALKNQAHFNEEMVKTLCSSERTNQLDEVGKWS